MKSFFPFRSFYRQFTNWSDISVFLYQKYTQINRRAASPNTDSLARGNLRSYVNQNQSYLSDDRANATADKRGVEGNIVKQDTNEILVITHVYRQCELIWKVQSYCFTFSASDIHEKKRFFLKFRSNFYEFERGENCTNDYSKPFNQWTKYWVKINNPAKKNAILTRI